MVVPDASERVEAGSPELAQGGAATVSVLPEWRFEPADLLPIGGAFNIGRKAAGQVPKAIPRAARPARNVASKADELLNASKITQPGPTVKAQADDAARLLQQTPTPPLTGLQTNKTFWNAAARPLAVGGSIVGTTAGVGYFLKPLGQGAAAAAPGVKDLTAAPFEGLGKGLAEMFMGLGAGLASSIGGAGVGTGGGIAAIGEGVGKALQSVLLPALLIGGGVLLYGALKK